jgi:D-serine deaminase-like pyridoxal phosphate-dependent protein
VLLGTCVKWYVGWMFIFSTLQVLYGVPPAQSAIPRLVHLASKLAPGSVNILIDNIDAFNKMKDSVVSGNFGVFIKIDTGYKRAGITVSSQKFPRLIRKVVGTVGDAFRGFYSHYGHSYAGNSEKDSAHGLISELEGLEEAAAEIEENYLSLLKRKMVLTVGATPTATAAQNMLSGSPRAAEFKTLLNRLKQTYTVELHAGVYPLLDMQQVATHARPATGRAALTKESVGIKVLLEISSVYDEREKPEALASAGSLALGREPCKSYPGWGVVTGELGNVGNIVYDERGDRTGWIVGRISQEHGILTWEGPEDNMKPLEIGSKVLVWPNHACVAGAAFGWYLVVDSEKGGHTVVDVWVRWRGW